MRRIGLVITAFNRPFSLASTLQSVSQLRTPSGAELEIIVSQDGPPNSSVDAVVQHFGAFFPIRRIRHKENLGLKKHVLFCGDLVTEFDLLVVVEDDVVVAPPALEVLVSAVEAYQDEPCIRQFSLYSPAFTESTRAPFVPIADGNPGYLSRVPQSWGQAYVPNQWLAFKNFLANPANAGVFRGDALPANAYSWPISSSWKRDYFAFMVSVGAYAWIPQVSLSSQTGAAGTHFKRPTPAMSVPMQMASGKFYHPNIDALCRYDEYGELEWESLTRLAGELSEFSGTVDLYGGRPLDIIDTPVILTSRRTRAALKTFGSDFLPLEMNIALKQPGSSISLSRIEDVIESQPLALATVGRWRPSKFAIENLILQIKSARKSWYCRTIGELLRLARPVFRRARRNT